MRTVCPLVLWLALSVRSTVSLNVGKRRIQCSNPVGGKPTEAIFDPKPTLPAITGFVGCQALFPALAKCPSHVQIQPSWYTGEQAGGLCPPEYWVLPPIAVGLVFLGIALALNSYSQENRLYMDDKGVGVVQVTKGLQLVSGADDLIPYRDIADWKALPVGLLVNRKSTDKAAFFPLFWHPQSVQALLNERAPQS